jgi:hypothetical protein
MALNAFASLVTSNAYVALLWVQETVSGCLLHMPTQAGISKNAVTTPFGLETQGLLRIAPDGSVQAKNPRQPRQAACGHLKT